jgi:hypothetical protein
MSPPNALSPPLFHPERPFWPHGARSSAPEAPFPAPPTGPFSKTQKFALSLSSRASYRRVSSFQKAQKGPVFRPCAHFFTACATPRFGPFAPCRDASFSASIRVHLRLPSCSIVIPRFASCLIASPPAILSLQGAAERYYRESTNPSRRNTKLEGSSDHA